MEVQSVAPGRTPSTILRVIAVFKFFKVVLLVLVGLGALELLNPEIADHARHWVNALAASSDRRAVQYLIALASGLNPQRLELVGMGAFLYAALYGVEGTGLWLGRRWAEYLTIIASALFVPLEIVEVVRRVTPSRVTALTVNLVIVVYLVVRLRRAKRAEAGGPGAAP